MIAGALLIASACACGGAAKGANTPLQQAAWDGNVEQVKALLAAGAKVDDEAYGVRPPLYLTIVQGQQRNTAVAKLLLAAGANPNATLATAVRNGDVKTLAMLAPKFVATNAASGRLLHVAVGMWCDDNAEMVRSLLAAGADPNAADEKGRRPLHNAAQYCHPQAVKLFLNAKAEHRNPIHSWKRSPRHYGLCCI